jgi:hypothetical protein
MIQLFVGWGETRFLGGMIIGRGNPKYLKEENPPQWNFLCHKTHTESPRIEHRPLW